MTSPTDTSPTDTSPTDTSSTDIVAPRPLTETAAALRLAVGRLSRRMRQESATGRSLTQLGIMATLERQGPTTLGELAEAERVAKPTVTKAVATLVDAGLVEKVGDVDDRRVSRARLTPQGRRELRDTRGRRDAWLATRLSALPSDDLDRLTALLPLIEGLTDDPDPSEHPHR